MLFEVATAGPRHSVAISLHVLRNVAGNYQEVLKTVDLKLGVLFLSVPPIFYFVYFLK